MPTTLLTIGPVHTLTQNIAVALPARLCNCFITPAVSTVEASNDQVTWVTVTVSAQGAFQPVGAFLRLTSAGPALMVATSR